MYNLKYSDLTADNIKKIAKTHPYITSFEYDTTNGGQFSYQQPIATYYYLKKSIGNKWFTIHYNGNKTYYSPDELVMELKKDKKQYTKVPKVAVIIQAFTPSEYEETEGGMFLIEENLPKYNEATLEGHKHKSPAKKYKKFPKLNVEAMF